MMEYNITDVYCTHIHMYAAKTFKSLSPHNLSFVSQIKIIFDLLKVLKKLYQMICLAQKF